MFIENMSSQRFLIVCNLSIYVRFTPDQPSCGAVFNVDGKFKNCGPGSSWSPSCNFKAPSPMNFCHEDRS